MPDFFCPRSNIATGTGSLRIWMNNVNKWPKLTLVPTQRHGYPHRFCNKQEWGDNGWFDTPPGRQVQE